MTLKHETHCAACGAKLITKTHPTDGDIPYCPACDDFRFPGFNTAVSMIVFNADKSRILLLDQYGKAGILVAGYVSRGDNLEDTVRREVMEETGLAVKDIIFNTSRYYEGSNTLMCNFACVVDADDLRIDTGEVDSARWVPVEDVLNEMLPHSLAQWFTRVYLDKTGRL